LPKPSLFITLTAGLKFIAVICVRRRCRRQTLPQCRPNGVAFVWRSFSLLPLPHLPPFAPSLPHVARPQSAFLFLTPPLCTCGSHICCFKCQSTEWPVGHVACGSGNLATNLYCLPQGNNNNNRLIFRLLSK